MLLTWKVKQTNTVKVLLDIKQENTPQIGQTMSQVKFYQGMLKQKGTKSAVDKLIRSKFDTISK